MNQHQKTEFKIVAGLAILIILVIGLLVWAINKNVALKQSEQLNGIIYKSAKNIIGVQKKQAEFKLKQSELRFDSINKIHVEFVEKSKRRKEKLNVNLNEIQNLNNITRSKYIDSVLRSRSIR